MSIATDEAEQWAQSRYVGFSHIECHDGRAVSVPDYPQKINLRREGYIAGRTAEPTEAEIEAAAKAMYENCAARWHASSSSGKWANAQVHKEYLIKARFALEAARQLVAALHAAA